MSASPPKKQRLSHHNKPKNYYKSNKRQYLEPGLRGFLATCNFREKDCVREAYNVLNHYADELYGAPVKEPPTDDAVPPEENAPDAADIADDLQKQIDDANASKQQGKGAAKQRFQVVDTGATNCVFIRTTLTDPVELGTRIVSEIARTHEQKTRFLLRLVPVEVVCRANLTDITNAGGALFDKHFLKESSTYAIVFNKRYNNDVKRDDVIRELAALVQSKNIQNRVDLKQAAKTVVVELIKGLCCIAVVDGYLQYKKYNLVELANVKQKPATEEKANGDDGGTAAEAEAIAETEAAASDTTAAEVDENVADDEVKNESSLEEAENPAKPAEDEPAAT